MLSYEKIYLNATKIYSAKRDGFVSKDTDHESYAESSGESCL